MFELKVYDKKMQDDIENFFRQCFIDLEWNFDLKSGHSDINNIQEIYMRNGCFWCLYLEKNIIGTVAIRSSIGDKIAELKRFYILNNYQGLGYGNLLIKTAIDFTKNNGYNKILADTRNDRKASKHLMEKYGFQQIPKYNANSLAELFYELVLYKWTNKYIDKKTKIGLNNFIVELYEHQIEWEQNANETIEYFKSIFGDLIVDVEHIGSTSIKTIKAKPIIDLIVGIKDFNNVNEIMEKMEINGLKYCPNRDGQEFRMFVIGDLDGILTHIIHLVEYNGNEWNNKINFRDYMNNNIEKAKEYENLKMKSMENNKNDVQNYHKSKEQFIIENIKEAKKWRKELVEKEKTYT